MPRVDTRFATLRKRRGADTLRALAKVFEAQLDEVSARGVLSARWDGVLAEVVFEENRATAREVGLRVARAFGDRRDPNFNPDVMDPWLTVNAERTATGVNESTRQDLQDQPAEDVFGTLMASRADMLAHGMVATAVGFAARDAARKNGGSVKVWQTNSGNPRSLHSSMSGVSVRLDDAFPNGMQFPGDWSGGAAQVANCKCSMTIL